MIRFDRVTVTYPEAEAPALVDVSLVIPEGELCLVVGRTGSGKSTLLRAVNGLVPAFTGGVLLGQVSVSGRATSDHPPREMADLVGYVDQVPSAGFAAAVVEDELAYTMENLGVTGNVMRRRVEEVIDLMGLAPLRRRPLRFLSAGEQQRVAIGAVLTASPRILVLDEPTSALDPGAAEEVLAALTRLVHDVGLTVLVAEHRLERVVQYADRVAVIEDGRVRDGDPADMMRTAPVAPPVVELGRLIGSSPLPLSVRDARRSFEGLRAGLRPVAAAQPAPIGEVIAAATGLVARYGDTTALGPLDLEVRRGEIIAVMGRNGAGKSTLLAQLAGVSAPSAGRVEVLGTAPHRLDGPRAVKRVALVPSDPGLLLYAASVSEECATADTEHRLDPGTTAAVLAEIVPVADPDVHPRDLSEGERLGLALAVVVAPGPPLLLLDEPTRGLDYDAKRRLVTVLQALAADGHAVVLATHDVELAADVATRVVIIADGEVIADGPARPVITGSALFAPQIARVVAPADLLTVREVQAALAG
ncbi:MAG: energy-coupling factor transport system ATP-binding protein [Actinomycetota bacterium]